MEHRKSIFFPLALIAAGVIWLMVSAGTIPSSNLWALTHIWPFFLMAAGLGLILRAYWKYAAPLMDAVIVGGAVLAIVFAPQLGWTNPNFFYIFQNGETYFGPSLPGSGNVISQTRQVSDFQAIDLEYPAQVFITQGEAVSLKIEAEDNMMPGLTTDVKNGTLEIDYKSGPGKRVNPRKPVIITIVAKDLNDVRFSSAGTLTIDGFKTDDLNLSLSGAGALKLNNLVTSTLTLDLSGAGSTTASGKADRLSLHISGFGDFNGSELHTKSSDVSISGAGSAIVWADEELSANISGAGSVSYYGPAKVTKQISGVGEVKHLGDK